VGAFRRAQIELDGFGAIPTIVMSANDAPSLSRLGTATFLQKPFALRELLSAVDGAIKNAA
jgi:hypothetical protein